MASLFRPEIYKKGKFLTYGNWTIKYRENGRIRTISTGFKDRARANEFFRNWNGKAKTRANILQVETAIMDDLEVNDFAPNTINLYRIVFTHLKELFTKPMNEFNVMDINRYKKYLKSKQPETVNIYLRTLRAIFNRAKLFKLIDEIPPITLLPVKQDTKQKTYSQDQFIALLTYLYNNGEFLKRKSNEFGFDTHSTQKQLLEFCLIAFYTGCRRNEILELHSNQINPETKTLTVIRYKKRGGKRFSEIPIHPYLWDRLLRFKVDLNNRLFDLKPNYVTHKIKSINRLLGFGDLKLHSIRHTYATELMKLNTNRYAIKDLLGHSAVATSEVYVHTDSGVLREHNAKLPELRY